MQIQGAEVQIIRNRKGRKRKSGRRTSNGAIVRPPPPNYRDMAAAQPHRIWLPESVRLSEKAGTVLGCLNLLKRISDDQYEAGRRYSVLVGAYHAVAGLPSAMSGNGRGYDCIGASDCPADSCICRIRTEKYMEAYNAVSRAAGRASHMAINQVAIWNEPITSAGLEPLRLGLNALIHHFGLTSGRKSVPR
jgi:hypothetical protein